MQILKGCFVLVSSDQFSNISHCAYNFSCLLAILRLLAQWNIWKVQYWINWLWNNEFIKRTCLHNKIASHGLNVFAVFCIFLFPSFVFLFVCLFLFIWVFFFIFFYRFCLSFHCVESVQIRSFFGPYFPVFALNTEKYRPEKNSVFAHFSHIVLISWGSLIVKIGRTLSLIFLLIFSLTLLNRCLSSRNQTHNDNHFILGSTYSCLFSCLDFLHNGLLQESWQFAKKQWKRETIF